MRKRRKCVLTVSSDRSTISLTFFGILPLLFLPFSRFLFQSYSHFLPVIAMIISGLELEKALLIRSTLSSFLPFSVSDSHELSFFRQILSSLCQRQNSFLWNILFSRPTNSHIFLITFSDSSLLECSDPRILFDESRKAS